MTCACAPGKGRPCDVREWTTTGVRESNVGEAGQLRVSNAGAPGVRVSNAGAPGEQRRFGAAARTCRGVCSERLASGLDRVLHVDVRLSRLPRVLFAAVLVLFGPVLVASIDRQEFVCEEAAQRLKDCCSGATFATNYCQPGGCGEPNGPVLTSEESDCIRQASCETLRANNICTRALRLEPRFPDAGVRKESVCP